VNNEPAGKIPHRLERLPFTNLSQIKKVQEQQQSQHRQNMKLSPAVLALASVFLSTSHFSAQARLHGGNPQRQLNQGSSADHGGNPQRQLNQGSSADLFDVSYGSYIVQSDTYVLNPGNMLGGETVTAPNLDLQQNTFFNYGSFAYGAVQVCAC
jgi:hypothetical protein